MTPSADVTGLVSLASAVLTAFQGNQGGVVVSFVLIAGLAWRLRQCERKHDESERMNQQLRTAVIQMSAAINTMAGNKVVDIGDLPEILNGQPAVKFGRRHDDKKPEAK